MAITAWSAKVFARATCLSVKGCSSLLRMTMTPMGTSSRRSGVASIVRVEA